MIPSCYTNPMIALIEKEIINCFNQCKYEQGLYLAQLRKKVLNDAILKNQKEILKAIIDFNEALRKALLEMYHRARRIWYEIGQKSEYGDEMELVAQCFLDTEYPDLHPMQGENRQDLWEALTDSCINPIYESGVSHRLSFPTSVNENFDTFIGMDCPPPNWNEGLDHELTKDLHLINQFHNLFDHTNFALTDFIYVRKFRTEIQINIEK